MDIAAIGSLLTSLKTATDIAKLIRESDVTLEKAETKLKLAELVSALADAKIDAAEIQQVILDRDEEIRTLKAASKIRAELIWKQPCYYMPNVDGVEEPYCQQCYDSESKLARLHTDGAGRFSCSVCKQTYSTSERSKRDSDALRAARNARNLSSKFRV